MENFTFAFLDKALIKSKACFRIAIVTELWVKSYLDKRKTIRKIYRKISKQNCTTIPNQEKKAPTMW